jgi:hypothetical protein
VTKVMKKVCREICKTAGTKVDQSMAGMPIGRSHNKKCAPQQWKNRKWWKILT